LVRQPTPAGFRPIPKYEYIVPFIAKNYSILNMNDQENSAETTVESLHHYCPNLLKLPVLLLIQVMATTM